MVFLYSLTSSQLSVIDFALLLPLYFVCRLLNEASAKTEHSVYHIAVYCGNTIIGKGKIYGRCYHILFTLFYLFGDSYLRSDFVRSVSISIRCVINPFAPDDELSRKKNFRCSVDCSSPPPPSKLTHFSMDF